MPLRLMEIVIPDTNSKKIKQLLDDKALIDSWWEEISEFGSLIKLLLPAEHTEVVLDILEREFSGVENFRVVLLAVEATIPRLEEAESQPSVLDETQKIADESSQAERISREELYTDVVDGVQLSKTYIALVMLSAIVAAVGLLRDNVAVIIGAMVIAPLLGPNVGLALATTLADFELGLKALKTNLVGFIIVLILSIFLGLIFNANPQSPEISARTGVFLSDIALALASGSAGVLAFTSGVSTALIGVMVAVALLPPLVTLGLLIGAGHPPEAIGALLLVLTNLICINLAGVSTFLVQGIRPRRWGDADKADKASRWAIVLWSVLLVVLATIISLSQ